MSEQIENDDAAETYRLTGVTRGVSRRGFMRAGAATAGAATVGYGTMQAPRYSPVGRADAALVTAGVVAGAFVAGFAGAYVYENYIANDGEEADFTDQDDQQANLEIYNTANSIKLTNEPKLRDIKNAWRIEWDSTNTEYVKGDAEATNFADVAWSEIRATLAQAFNNGDGTTAAADKAKSRHDVVTTRAAINLLEDSNAIIKAHAELLYQTLDRGFTSGEGISRLTYDNDYSADYVADSRTWMDTFLEGPSGGTAIGETSATFPANPGDVEGIEEGTEYTCLIISYSGGRTSHVPDSLQEAGDAITVDYGSDDPATMQEFFGHSADFDSSLDPVRSIDQQLYAAAFEQLDAAHKAIRGDIDAYAEAVQDAISAGDIDPDDILTPEDITDHFSDGSTSERLTVELAVSGVATPTNLGDDIEVTIDHPETGELTGRLFVQPETTEGFTVQEGESIAAADYRGAYLIETYEDGDGEEQVNSHFMGGNDPLSIVEIHGDQTELQFDTWATRVSDPSQGDDIQAHVEKISELRTEIEEMREEIANEDDPGGAGGGWFDSDGKTLGVVAGAAALAALLWSGSGDS